MTTTCDNNRPDRPAGAGRHTGRTAPVAKRGPLFDRGMQTPATVGGPADRRPEVWHPDRCGA